MNSLEIISQFRGDEVVLVCSGRLDANRSGHLNDHIEKLVREGQYHIILDLNGIEYLSSSGIRILVKHYRNLKEINGYLYIESMSANVEQVLGMVGMSAMLRQKPQKAGDGKTVEEEQNQTDAYGFVFRRQKLTSGGKTTLEVYGKPELTIRSGFTPADARNILSENHRFAIGLGAIGNSFTECRERFGEFMMMGKNVVYLPADGSKKPDYMVATGQLVVPVTELYGLHFTGNFSQLINFEPGTAENPITLSRLLKTILDFSGYERMAFVMVAESGGLIGVSLNASPVDGKKIFSFPEIKETINFTTEHAHVKMLTISAGYVSSADNGEAAAFVRPLGPGQPLRGHVHTSVFPFIPLKKNDPDLQETVGYVFNNAEVTDLLHLTNDTREITGQGESQFLKGFCWIVPVESIQSVSK